MKSLRKLHVLIHALSRDEKRYFKQYANIYSSEKDQEYILLFDIISKYKIFNLSTLKKEIKKRKIGYLPLKTKYLYTIILDVLCRKKKKQNKQIQLEDELRHISILEDKGFLEEALNRLDKLKPKAKSLNLYLLLYKIHSKESEILGLRDHGNLSKAYLNAFEEKNKYFNILQNINNYRAIAILFHQEKTITQEFIQNYIQHPLLQNEHLALSLKAKISFYNIWSSIYQWQGNLENLLISTKKIVELLPQAVHISPSKKLSLFQNYFVSTFAKKSYKDFLFGLNILKSIPFPYKQHKAIAINLEIGFLMSFYIKNIYPYTPEDAKKILDRNEIFYKQYQHFLHWHIRKLWFFDIVCFGILLQDIDIIDLWLDRIINEVKRKDLNEEEKLTIKILNTILFYERGIQSLIEREIKSIFYFIETKKLTNPILLEVTAFLDGLYKAKDNKQKLILLKKYLLILEKINPRISDTYWDLSIISQWIQLKIQKLDSALLKPKSLD